MNDPDHREPQGIVTPVMNACNRSYKNLEHDLNDEA